MKNDFINIGSPQVPKNIGKENMEVAFSYFSIKNWVFIQYC